MPSILPLFSIVNAFCVFSVGSSSHCTLADESSFIQEFALAEPRAHQPTFDEQVEEQVKKIENEMGGHSLSLATLDKIHEITHGHINQLRALAILLGNATEKGIKDLNALYPTATLGVFDQAAIQALNQYTAALEPVVKRLHAIYNTTVPALKNAGCPVISLEMGNNLSQALDYIDRLDKTAKDVEQIVMGLDTVASPLVDANFNTIATKLNNMKGWMNNEFATNIKNAFNAYTTGLLSHVEALAEEDEKAAMLERIHKIGPLVNVTIPLLAEPESKLASGFSQAISARKEKPPQLIETQRNQHHRQHRHHRRS